MPVADYVGEASSVRQLAADPPDSTPHARRQVLSTISVESARSAGGSQGIKSPPCYGLRITRFAGVDLRLIQYLFAAGGDAFFQRLRVRAAAHRSRDSVFFCNTGANLRGFEERTCGASRRVGPQNGPNSSHECR